MGNSGHQSDWLIADIGGTHARLACWNEANGIDRVQRLVNDDYPSPVALLRDYVAHSGCRAQRATLALAMPIDRQRATLTNRAWTFSEHLLLELGWEELRLVNDFTAAAAGVESLPASEFEIVTGNGMLEDTVRLVLGPGTGLGAAAVIASTRPPLIVASEAGHTTFAPSSAADYALIDAAREIWPRVSWERIVCGSGLAWLDALERDVDVPALPSDVSARAIAGEVQAVRAANRFSRLLGEFAGDLCLAFAAFGGVSLCGGVLNGLASSFNRDEFIAGFTDKGRFGERLSQVTCRRLFGHDTGLLGLAHYLAGRCVLPTMQFGS